MDKIILGLFGSASIIGISILTMIYGWGLTPNNWYWIILGNVGAILLGTIIKVAVELND